MGEIAVGDRVFDERGQVSSVTAVSPTFVGGKCFEVEFSDGTTVVADANHEWFAYDWRAWKSRLRRTAANGGGHGAAKSEWNKRYGSDQSHKVVHPRVVTTAQMLVEGLLADGNKRQNWRVEVAQPIQLPEASLPVDPYVFGCWLGDGETDGSRMTIGSGDAEHFQEQFTQAGYRLAKNKTKYEYSTAPAPGLRRWSKYEGPTRHLLRELQTMGFGNGASKRIPAIYLRASVAQRLALLQGLMDTDGAASKDGSVEIVLANHELLKHVRELVCSLGHRPAAIKEKPVTLPDGRVVMSWRVKWSTTDVVFRLQRKCDRALQRLGHRFTTRMTTRAVMAIREVPSVSVRCISVDSPSRLYLATESMIPTHNSALMMQMAIAAAMRDVTGVISLEMSADSLMDRAVAQVAGVDAFRMKTGHLTLYEQKKCGQAFEQLATAHLHVDDVVGLTATQMRAKVRRFASRKKLKSLFIDYVQLMREGGKFSTRNEELTAISRGIKLMAIELNIPIVVLSQLSRSGTKDEDKPPTLADMRESGALEQDADVVMLIWRHTEGGEKVVDLIIAKQRNGPTGLVRLRWFAEQMRFASLDDVEPGQPEQPEMAL